MTGAQASRWPVSAKREFEKSNRDGCAPVRFLKLQPSLKLNYSSSQSSFRDPEKRVLDLRAGAVEIKRLQIQQIEDVEEVRLYFKVFSFSQEPRQSKFLG
jgi:hypothetical protein